MTDMLVGCWAEDIHGNIIKWVQRIPVDTIQSKQFWDGING